MLRSKRPLLASILAISVFVTGWAPAAFAYEPFDDRPGELAMTADILIARPVLAVGTVVGLGLFTLALPASLLGDNVDEAAEKLVKAPGRATFLRCLGCTPQQHLQRKSEREVERVNK